MKVVFDSILLSSFWGTCFTVLFMLINKLCNNKLPVSWHYYIWLVVIVRLLVPAFITVNIEAKELASTNRVEDIAKIESTENIIAVVDNSEKEIVTQAYNMPTDDYVGLVSTEDTTVKQIFQADKLWLIWFIIAILLLANKFLSYFLYIKKLKFNSILPNEVEMNIFSKQKESLNIKRRIKLIKHDGVQTPFAVGLFNLMVVLPYREYSNMQLNYIFQHELTHIKRHDIEIKWLYEIAKAVHWFNPFVYMATKNADFYCETSCDAVVLKNSTTNERKEYGMIILDLIEQAVNQKKIMCVSMYNNKSNLKKRIHHILNSNQIKRSMAMPAIIITLTFILGACSTVQIQETPKSETALDLEATIDKLDNIPVLSKEKTNLLIAGIDNLGIADTILIASFDTTTEKISLLSVSRDTYLSASEETVLQSKQQGIEIPVDIRLGQVTYYTNSMEQLQKEITNTLAIPIDYYIRIEMSAFENLIDAIGGVEITVREEGLYYEDPYQELSISLDGGIQLLDGEKALMLARFRSGYARGDSDRMDVQRELLQAVYSQIINGDNIVEKSKNLFSILTENTETNLSLKDITPYLQYIPKINVDSMQTFQLPVEATYLQDIGWFTIIDENEFETSIAGIFR